MTSLRLIRENVSKSTQRPVADAVDVYNVMKFLEKEDREKFYVLHLDAKNRILAMELVSIGTLTASLVHPREVFKAAIMNNSCGIVCVHNHPSGDTAASLEDRILTKRLKDAGEIIGINVLDHVIIGHSGFGRVITLEEEAKAKELQRQHEIEQAKAQKKTPRRSKRKMKAA